EYMTCPPWVCSIALHAYALSQIDLKIPIFFPYETVKGGYVSRRGQSRQRRPLEFGLGNSGNIQGESQLVFVAEKSPSMEKPAMLIEPEPVMTLPGARPVAVGVTLTLPLRVMVTPLSSRVRFTLPLVSSRDVIVPEAVWPSTMI